MFACDFRKSPLLLTLFSLHCECHLSIQVLQDVYEMCDPSKTAMDQRKVIPKLLEQFLLIPPGFLLTSCCLQLPASRHSCC